MSKAKIIIIFFGLSILTVIGILFVNNFLVLLDTGNNIIAKDTIIYTKALISNISAVIKTIIKSIVFWLVGLVIVAAYIKNLIKGLNDGKK